MSDELEAAIQLHQAGRLREAELAYRKLLNTNPRNARALHLLGLVAHQSGHHPQAAARIKQAIDVDGSVPAFHQNLALVQRAMGLLEAAIQSYRRAIDLGAGSAEVWTNLGGLLFDAGDHDAAIAACQKAIQLDPNVAAAYSNLGNAQRAKGEFAAARTSHTSALRLQPNSAMLHINFADLLHDVGDSAGAVVHCQRAAELEPRNPNLKMALGRALRMAGRTIEAERAFQAVSQQQPESGMACAQLAQTLDALGNREEALAQYRKSLALDPTCVLAWVNLGTYHRGSITDDDLQTMRQLVQHPHLPDGARSGLHFALGQVFDLQDEFAMASKHMLEGNRLQRIVNQRRGRFYEPATHAAQIDQVIDCFDEAYFNRRPSEARGAHTSRLPIAIVGMPRSGTSLTEQILASHAAVCGGGEQRWLQRSWESAMKPEPPRASLRHRLLPLAVETVQQAADAYLQQLRALDLDAQHVTDKLPENYICLGWMVSMFPAAPLVHCCRADAATAFSCWQTSFEGVLWANDPQHILSRLQQYHRLMDHWRAVLPTPIFDMHYEQTVTEPEKSARGLLGFVGLPWDAACLNAHVTDRAVQTASVTQVREPIYSRSLDRWQKYLEFLPELLEPLQS